MVIQARDESWSDQKIRGQIRSALGVDAIDLIVDEASEMSETMVGVVLDEFAEQTEDFVLAISPLGDAVGWRAAILVGDIQAQLGAASDPVWSEAVSKAVARARHELEKLKEESADANS